MEVVELMGDRIEVHVTGADSGGAVCVCVDFPSPGFRLVPHRHRNESETIHIVEGTFAFVLEGEERTLGPGDTVHVPKGAVHAIRNCGEGLGRRVLVFQPAGIEGFFLGAPNTPPGELLALAQAHGWEFVQPS